MQYLLPAMMKLLYQHDAKTLFQPSFFESRHSEAVDRTFIVVKPIAQFKDGDVELKYQVGTRGNGIDMPVWPEDLKTEIVKG